MQAQGTYLLGQGRPGEAVEILDQARRAIAPTVAAHSIISAISGEASATANDGVVESAHLDGVESELVVKSAHSCQSNPHTVAEVQRILLEHLAEQRR